MTRHMDEIYKAKLAGEGDAQVIVTAVVGIHPRDETQPIYELNTEAVINGIPFPIRFGAPGGGYVGAAPLEERIREAQLEVDPTILHREFQERAPNLWADFVEDQAEIKIIRIERHCLSRGQDYCFRTLRQLLTLTPAINSVFYDWITNGPTREAILPALSGSLDPCLLSGLQSRSALVRSLVRCGFADLHIVPQGKEDFGIRGYRSSTERWTLDKIEAAPRGEFAFF